MPITLSCSTPFSVVSLWIVMLIKCTNLIINSNNSLMFDSQVIFSVNNARNIYLKLYTIYIYIYTCIYIYIYTYIYETISLMQSFLWQSVLLCTSNFRQCAVYVMKKFGQLMQVNLWACEEYRVQVSM